MSTSILYHAFGIRGVKMNSVEFVNGEIHFQAETVQSLARCPECRSRDTVSREKKQEPSTWSRSV